MIFISELVSGTSKQVLKQFGAIVATRGFRMTLIEKPRE